MYKLRNPFDYLDLWDFSSYIPDIVVVNLFQNDAGIVKRPEYIEFKKRFGTMPPTDELIIKSYRNFISVIRQRYQKASIICALGSMNASEEGSVWRGYVERAVAELHDPKVFTHFFTYKNSAGHPRVTDHQVMAKSLIDFIDRNIKW